MGGVMGKFCRTRAGVSLGVDIHPLEMARRKAGMAGEPNGR